MSKKAFTHLCKKINLSLYDDTITIYLKDDNQDDIDNFCTTAINLNASHYVNRYNSKHNLYHQDNFDKKSRHTHAQFENTIDIKKLREILSILEKAALITSQEHNSFIKAYHEANPLPDDAPAPKRIATPWSRFKNNLFYSGESSTSKKETNDEDKEQNKTNVDAHTNSPQAH